MYAIASCVYIVLDAQLIIQIGNVFGDPANWQHNVTILGILVAARTVFGISEGMLNRSARYKVFESMNNRFVDKVLDADYKLFTEFSVARITTISDFMNRVTSVGVSLVQMISQACTIVVSLGSMYLLAGNMIIPVVGMYIIGVILMRYLYKVYDKQARKFEKVRRARNQELENVINGFQEVRTFNVIEHERKKIRGMNRDMRNVREEKQRTDVCISGLVEVLDSVGIIIVAMYTVSMVANGTMTAATAMTVVMFVVKLTWPLIQILNFTDELSDNLALSKDYDSFMKFENQHRPDATIDIGDFNDSIRVKNVRFAYSNTSSVLNGLDMVIRKGERVGICGETGDGKSTLLKLLNRFYLPDSGHISIDHVNMDQITMSSYRKLVGSVQQENIVFPGSIRDNILFAVPNATEYELIEACKKAELYNFVSKLPEKFDTVVGPRGLTLSGGQKQRIALARLFLQDPEIILLDEATSALDNETETLIQDAIAKLEGKTIITVAHRLSTIKDCDCIYVMKGGRVAEFGTHEKLIERGGIYAAMNK
jgi:ABC-type multidrug transport system fused ATPase/permease subunit